VGARVPGRGGGSRLARPDLRAWAGGEPLRSHEPSADAADPDPNARAGYGLPRRDTGGMLRRFVTGRPVSPVTEDFRAWACDRRAAQGQRASLLIRDHAAWHVRARVRARIKGA